MRRRLSAVLMAVVCGISAFPVMEMPQMQAFAAENTRSITMQDIKATQAYVHDWGYAGTGEAVDLNGDDVVDVFDLALAKRQYSSLGAISLLYFRSDIVDIDIEACKSELVTFTVTVESEAAVGNKVIGLYDDTDKRLTYMHDDGKNGDEEAGDHVYSAQIEVSSSEMKLVPYYAAAGDARSDTFELNFYRHFTDEEIDTYEEIDNTIAEMSYEDALAYLRDCDQVDEYIGNPETGSIYYLTSAGIPCIIAEIDNNSYGAKTTGDYSFERPDYPLDESVPYTANMYLKTEITGNIFNQEVESGLVINAADDEDARNLEEPRINAMSTGIRHIIEEQENNPNRSHPYYPAFPDKRDVFVYRPFCSEVAASPTRDVGEIIADAIGGSCTAYDDGDATVETLKELGRKDNTYGVILLETHGMDVCLTVKDTIEFYKKQTDVWTKKYGYDLGELRHDVLLQAGASIMLTGTEVSTQEYIGGEQLRYTLSSEWNHEYDADYRAARFIIVTDVSPRKLVKSVVRRICVTENFFKCPEYFGENCFRNALIHMNVCFGMYGNDRSDNRLCNELLDKGAQAVVGFSDRVDCRYASAVTVDTLINGLLLRGETLEESIDSIHIAIQDTEEVVDGGNRTFNGGTGYKYIDKQDPANDLTHVEYAGNKNYRLVMPWGAICNQVYEQSHNKPAYAMLSGKTEDATSWIHIYQKWKNEYTYEYEDSTTNDDNSKGNNSKYYEYDEELGTEYFTYDCDNENGQLFDIDLPYAKFDSDGKLEPYEYELRAYVDAQEEGVSEYSENPFIQNRFTIKDPIKFPRYTSIMRPTVPFVYGMIPYHIQLKYKTTQEVHEAGKSAELWVGWNSKEFQSFRSDLECIFAPVDLQKMSNATSYCELVCPTKYYCYASAKYADLKVDGSNVEVKSPVKSVTVNAGEESAPPFEATLEVDPNYKLDVNGVWRGNTQTPENENVFVRP